MTSEAQTHSPFTARGAVNRRSLFLLREAMRTRRNERAERRAFAREVAALPATRSAAGFFPTHGR